MILWQYSRHKSWVEKWNDAIDNIDEFIEKSKHKNIVEILTEYCKPGSSLLELGSAPFWLIVLLRSKGVNAYGLEYEDSLVKRFQKRYPARKSWVLTGDARKLPFNKGHFDATTSIGLIEHFTDRNVQVQMVKEHARVIKKDGVALISVPWLNPLRMLLLPFSLVRQTINRIIGYPFYQKIYSTRAFEKLLNDGGLRVERYVPLSKNHMLLAVCRRN